MKFNHIRNVLAVAETGSLRAAARKVGAAQPAITRSIQEIELELGAALFERHSRGMRLTVIGEAFLRRASVVDTELRRAREEVEQLKGLSTGRLKVALSIASTIALLPAAFAAFHKRYPDAVLELSETLLQPIENDLAEGKIDLYVGALDVMAVSKRLTVEKIFENQRIVVARKGHPLLDATSLQDLIAAEWVWPRTNQGLDDDFEGWFRRIDLQNPRIVLVTRSALQTVAVVGASDLLAMMPRQWLELPALAERLDFLPVVGAVEAAPVCLVRQTGVPLTPMAEHFCEIIRRLGGAYRKQGLKSLLGAHAAAPG